MENRKDSMMKKIIVATKNQGKIKEMMVNIITVKAVRNIPICVKSLSVMYTASPPFKVQRTFGR